MHQHNLEMLDNVRELDSGQTPNVGIALIFDPDLIYPIIYI